MTGREELTYLELPPFGFARLVMRAMDLRASLVKMSSAAPVASRSRIVSPVRERKETLVLPN